MVGTVVVSIVSDLDEEDERSEDNLDIIANVYENITDLVESGEILVSENVRYNHKKNLLERHVTLANSLQRPLLVL